MAYLTIDFVRPVFHGLTAAARPEWPPSPVRLMGALIAGAHALPEQRRRAALDAIAMVAESPAPSIDVPEGKRLHHPPTYTEKSAPTSTRGLRDFLDLSRAGMSTTSRTLKHVDGTLLEGTQVGFVLDVDDDLVPALDDAASQVPYFGRSHDHASLGVTVDEHIPEYTSRRTPRIVASGEWRGWNPLTPRWFEARFEALFRSPSNLIPEAGGAVTPLDYRPHQTARPPEPDGDGASELSFVPFTSGVQQSVLPRLLVDIAPHPGAERFPVINHYYGDSRCHGIAVRGTSQDRRTEVSNLTSRLAERSRPPMINFGLRSEGVLNFYRNQTSQRRWVTVTPIRAFGHRIVLEKSLSDAAGMPVEVVAAATDPQFTWQRRWPNGRLVDGRSTWFVEFITAEPVDGPLLIGERTDLGFGLCVPTSTTRTAR
jgi:hypothetical protein